MYFQQQKAIAGHFSFEIKQAWDGAARHYPPDFRVLFEKAVPSFVFWKPDSRGVKMFLFDAHWISNGAEPSSFQNPFTLKSETQKLPKSHSSRLLLGFFEMFKTRLLGYFSRNSANILGSCKLISKMGIALN